MMFVRYVAIQLIAYAIDMGVFLTLLDCGLLKAVAANVLGKIVAGVFAFFVHQRFTFQVVEDSRNKSQLFRYFALLALNVPASSAILDIALRYITWPIAAKFFSDVACVLISFFVSRLWVFPGRREEKVLDEEAGHS